MSIDREIEVKCSKCGALVTEYQELKAGALLSIYGTCSCGHSYSSDDYAQLWRSDFVDKIRAGNSAVSEKECCVCGGKWKEAQMDILETVNRIGEVDICIDCLSRH